MADFQGSTDALQTMMKSAQAALATGPVMATQTTHYWQAQDRFLTEFEKFSTDWFKRHHAATQAARDASKEMTEEVTKDPAAAIKVMTQWQTHAMKRLTEEAQACTEMMTNCIGALVQNEVEAVEESIETTKRAMKQSKSEPV
ncbi:hypothetical protein C1J03_23975 (plasmid) [Sulfitobacter sp. SK012]|uniref:hypothetical protein n=1 Tax=Sulfitobacter sp. SK012 TaxID=1389005 RepID=UPI000E0B87CB|nr:hypothetical protein [Sulfitobacter sp. SK012]AXI49169.1 hypothetical protein C1J03_23975 [Sulfitobacter sp. SK012]